MGLLEEAGIRVPKFRVAETPDQVYQIAASKGWILVCLHLFVFILFDRTWN